MQLYKLKLGIKTGTEETLNILSSVIGDSLDETNFSYELLLSDKFQGFVNLLRINHQVV